MKKLIYACLITLIAMSFGCEKEEVQIEESAEDSILISKRDLGFGDENGNTSGGNSACPPSTDYDTHVITYHPSWNELDQEVYRLIFQANGTLLCYIESPTDSQVETWYVVQGSPSCDNQHGDPCPNDTGGKGNPPIRNYP